MLKKVISVVAAVVIIGGVGYLVFQPKEKPVADPQNATYSIDGESFTLVNGKSETEIVPGSASKVYTQYFGNEVKGDFNADGKEDVAFLFTQDGGGSGTFFYVATLLSSEDGHKGTNAIFLGDRIAPQTTEFMDETIIVNYAERAPGEPMTADPSVGVSKYFRISDGTLNELPAGNVIIKNIGGDKDEHNCIGSAGYSWCEAKSKCLRVFEEFCADSVATLVGNIKNETGVSLTGGGETIFDWRVGNGGTISKIPGVMYSAQGVKMADYNKVEKYFNNNFTADINNQADGVQGGQRSYFVNYMACLLNFRHNEMKTIPGAPSVPVGDNLKVTLECGYFNQNNTN